MYHPFFLGFVVLSATSAGASIVARPDVEPGARSRSPAIVSVNQGGPRTIWDGVYTDAQAERGQRAYKTHCGYCHRDNLTGGGSEAGAPALIGPIFEHRWGDQTLADLFVTIGTTMPQNDPDTLAPQTVIDIVSFLLKSNGSPASDAELPARVDALKEVAMTPRAR